MCPECKEGELVERITRKRGKPFYGCGRFPKCRFAVWEKPKDVADALRLKAEQAERTAARMKGKGVKVTAKNEKTDKVEKKPVKKATAKKKVK